MKNNMNSWAIFGVFIGIFTGLISIVSLIRQMITNPVSSKMLQVVYWILLIIAIIVSLWIAKESQPDTSTTKVIPKEKPEELKEPQDTSLISIINDTVNKINRKDILILAKINGNYEQTLSLKIGSILRLRNREQLIFDTSFVNDKCFYGLFNGNLGLDTLCLSTNIRYLILVEGNLVYKKSTYSANETTLNFSYASSLLDMAEKKYIIFDNLNDFVTDVTEDIVKHQSEDSLISFLKFKKITNYIQ